MKVEIIPAILPKSFNDLSQHLERVRGIAKFVQIDVVDGRFASNTTWPYVDAGSFEKIVAGDSGMPHWDSFEFEFDLMVNDAASIVEQYISAGAARIIIHASAHGALEAARALNTHRGGEFALGVGIALKASDTPDALQAFDGLYDYVQVMGIVKEGFQGQPFETHSLELIQALRALQPALTIQVDGAVSLQTAHAFAQAGASRLVTGNAIFGTDDPQAAIAELARVANEEV